jgi:hypothetical protein
MPKSKPDEQVGMPGIVRPENLWGKPLPQKPERTKESSEMLYEEELHEEDLRALVEETDVLIDDPSDEELRTLATAGEYEDDDDEDSFGAEDADDETSFVDDAADDATESSAAKENTTAAAVATVHSAGVKPINTKKRKKEKMAEKMSISDHIRREIEKRQESGDSLRGVDIKNSLEKRGVLASPAQISQLLKKAGVAPTARGPKKNKEGAKAVLSGTAKATSEPPKKRRQFAGRAAQPESRKTAIAPTSSLNLPMEKLQATTDFVSKCGSVQEAMRMLDIAVQLSQGEG